MFDADRHSWGISSFESRPNPEEHLDGKSK
jgi:hypothetical protein